MTRIRNGTIQCPPDATMDELDHETGKVREVPLFPRVIEAAKANHVSASFHGEVWSVCGAEADMMAMKIAIPALKIDALK